VGRWRKRDAMRVRKEEVKKVHEKGGGLEEKDLRLVGRARASHPLWQLAVSAYLQICFHPDHYAQHSARGVGEGYSTREEHRRGVNDTRVDCDIGDRDHPHMLPYSAPQYCTVQAEHGMFGQGDRRTVLPGRHP